MPTWAAWSQLLTKVQEDKGIMLAYVIFWWSVQATQDIYSIMDPSQFLWHVPEAALSFVSIKVKIWWKPADRKSIACTIPFLQTSSEGLQSKRMLENFEVVCMKGNWLGLMSYVIYDLQTCTKRALSYTFHAYHGLVALACTYHTYILPVKEVRDYYRKLFVIYTLPS